VEKLWGPQKTNQPKFPSLITSQSPPGKNDGNGDVLGHKHRMTKRKQPHPHWTKTPQALCLTVSATRPTSELHTAQQHMATTPRVYCLSVRMRRFRNWWTNLDKNCSCGFTLEAVQQIELSIISAKCNVINFLMDSSSRLTTLPANTFNRTWY
jgi:hypothetical protein